MCIRDRPQSAYFSAIVTAVDKVSDIRFRGTRACRKQIEVKDLKHAAKKLRPGLATAERSGKKATHKACNLVLVRDMGFSDDWYVGYHVPRSLGFVGKDRRHVENKA